MTFKINKGVGKSFEFKGLQSTYVFIALGGVIGAILLYFLLGLFLPFGVTIGLTILFALICVGGAYFLSAKYGEHGIRFAWAARKTVQRVHNNMRISVMMRMRE